MGRAKGAEAPPKFFQIRFLIDGSRHRNANRGAILYSLQINHFLHRDRDENIKCKAYFGEFGQAECVYFTINETSNKQVLKNLNNMVPMLQKKTIWSQCYINTCLHKVFTLHIRCINRTYTGVAVEPWPSKFLEYLVILCLKRQYVKKYTVVRVKSNILTHPKFWAGHDTAHVSI